MKKCYKKADIVHKPFCINFRGCQPHSPGSAGIVNLSLVQKLNGFLNDAIPPKLSLWNAMGSPPWMSVRSLL